MQQRCKLFVTCILVQRRKAASQKGVMKYHLCFCVFQQYSRPFVFRADTLCCWSDGSVLSRFLLRNHCRVGTFIGIDFCVFSPSLFQLQSSEVWCFRTSVELLSVFCSVILQDRPFVARLRSLGSVVLTASLLHAHLIAAWTPRYAYSPLRSRATARAQKVTNTHSFFFFFFFGGGSKSDFFVGLNFVTISCKT